MQGKDIRLLQHLITGFIHNPILLRLLLIRVQIIRHNIASKPSTQNIPHQQPDLPCPNNPYRLAVEIEADEPGEGEIAFARAVEGFVVFADEGEEEADGEFGDGVGGVGGDVDGG